MLESAFIMYTANRDMRPAGGGLEKILIGSLRRVPQGNAPLLAWPLACGSKVGARTRAIDFANGILQVQVSDSGWRNELRALAPRYLAAVNRYCGGKVQRIEFVLPQNPMRP